MMTDKTPSRFLLLNYLKPEPAQLTSVTQILSRLRPEDEIMPRSLYRNDAGDRVIEFIGLHSLSRLEALLGNSARWEAGGGPPSLLTASSRRWETEQALRPLLTADFRRQVHTLRDVVKDPKASVPIATNLQLRRIEVPPPVLAEYEAWRRNSIFSFVRKTSLVDSFLAYHSVISTEPGVLFLSTFSGSIGDYQAAFQTPEYQEFVKFAGEHYITGGPASLHTSLWTRVPIA